MKMAYGGVIIKRCRRMLNETDAAAAVLADGDYMMLETGRRRTTAERQ